MLGRTPTASQKPGTHETWAMCALGSAPLERDQRSPFQVASAAAVLVQPTAAQCLRSSHDNAKGPQEPGGLGSRLQDLPSQYSNRLLRANPTDQQDETVKQSTS
jgi:hypothetical protein